MSDENDDFVVELLPSGRVRFVIDDNTYLWKRATIGFLKQMDEFAAKAEDSKPTTTYMERWSAWWVFMFEGLAGTKIEIDDMPASLLNMELIAEVRNHLWSVPLVRSPRGQESPPASTDQG